MIHRKEIIAIMSYNESNNAYDDLMDYLDPDETVEALVFGAWGWGCRPNDNSEWEPGHGEPDPTPVPFDMRGKVLSLEAAEPLMRSWSFYGGYGVPECYATNIWTNKRIIWVTQHDGATRLNSALRNPAEYLPDMPGGG